MEVFITQHEKKSYSLVSSFFFLMITLKQINTENQGWKGKRLPKTTLEGAFQGTESTWRPHCETELFDSF